MTRDLYAETVTAQLKVWDDEINHLGARADIILAQAEDHYYCLLRSLRAKERELANCLTTLKVAPDDDWESQKAHLTRTTSEMKNALTEAAREIA